MKPEPQPVDPSRLADLALETMRKSPFPMMATCNADGLPSVRPVSPVKTDGFEVWVASFRSSGKTAELDANPQVELCYLDAAHDQVRIAAEAETVSDLAVKQALFADNPLLRNYLGSPDNPEFVLYRLVPRRVRFMREWALDYHEVPFAAPSAA